MSSECSLQSFRESVLRQSSKSAVSVSSTTLALRLIQRMLGSFDDPEDVEDVSTGIFQRTVDSICEVLHVLARPPSGVSGSASAILRLQRLFGFQGPLRSLPRSRSKLSDSSARTRQHRSTTFSPMLRHHVSELVWMTAHFFSAANLSQRECNTGVMVQ